MRRNGPARIRRRAHYPETEVFERGFSDHFDREIRPLLQEEATVDRRTWSRYPFAVAVVAVLVGVGIADVLEWVRYPIVSDVPDMFRMPGWIASVFCGGRAVLLWADAPARRENARLKRKLLSPIFAFWGIRHGSRLPFPRAEIERTDLLPVFTTVHLDDGLYGTWAGVPFSAYEVRLEWRRAFLPFGASHDVFEGLIVRFRHGRSDIRKPIAFRPLPGVVILPGEDLEPKAVWEARRWTKVFSNPGSVNRGFGFSLTHPILPPRRARSGPIPGWEASGLHLSGGGEAYREYRPVIDPLLRPLARLQADVGRRRVGFAIDRRDVWIKIRRRRALFERFRLGGAAPTVREVKAMVRELHDVLEVVEAFARAFPVASR